MSENIIKDYTVIFISLLLGMILTIIPMPEWSLWLRPHWVLAILIFWLLTASYRVGIGFAWLVGFFMDLLSGTLLGQQALLFCLTAYVVLRFQQWIVHMPILQQTAVILLLVFLNLIVDRCLLIVFQHTMLNWRFWLPALTTAVIWPWLSGLLYFYQIKLGVAD